VAAAGSLMMLSTSSSTPVEAVAPAAGNTWMQLYWMNDRGITRALVERAEAAGVHALALTVDAPRLGWREREARHGDWETGGVVQVHLPDPWPDGLAIEAGLTWRDLDWLRGITRLPIVLKGVLTAEDARIAADEGIPGIVVSNHGGRQIDFAQSAIDALPPISDAVGDRVELYLDSGVRRGTDVLKALALGARAVFLGRPVHWALALGGEAGVRRLFALVDGELGSAMGILGAASLDALGPDAVVRRPGW
ncbi:MAG: alpha-hydroxy acid oxidase, partial [Chloroflexota bacterium]